MISDTRALVRKAGAICAARYDTIVVSVAAALVLYMIATTAIGAVNHYSPVPFLDMWDGIVFFNARVANGDMAVWLFQHVNHRTVVSNLFFYLDEVLFGGRFIALTVLHFVLMGLIAALFAAHVRAFRRADRVLWDRAAILAIVLLSFSWLQWRNITWAFQSQMYFVVLLPLAGLLLVALLKSRGHGAGGVLILLAALVCGFLSVFTMMNGLLALPCMIALGLACRIRAYQIAAMGLTFALASWIFFRDYIPPEGQGSMLDTLAGDPAGVATFVVSLIAAPVQIVHGAGGSLACWLIGGAQIIAAGVLVVATVRNPVTRTPGLLLTAVLAYAFGSMTGIAAGRLIHGMDQAFESRYMTMVLFYWSAFLALVWTWGTTLAPLTARRAAVLFLVLPAIVLPHQSRVTRHTLPARFEQMQAMLAIEMKVQDAAQIMHVWPWMDVLYILAERPDELDLSIFGNPLFQGLEQTIGQPHPLPGAAPDDCAGRGLTLVSAEPGEGHVRLRLSMDDCVMPDPPRRLTLVTPEGRTAGYLLTSRAVPDPLSISAALPAVAGGYVVDEALPEALILTDGTMACTLASS